MSSYFEGLRLLGQRDPATAAELSEWERERRALSLPEPQQEYAVCARHDWRPPRRGVAPPASMCPACIAEADHLERKPPVGDAPTRERVAPENVGATSFMDRKYQEHLEAKAADGALLPGSLEEQRAVEQADREHRKAVARDHPKQKVAFERIEGGRVVQYHHSRKSLTSWARKSSGAKWRESHDDTITVDA